MIPNTQPITLLGFDFGMKRIGIAVGQTLTQTARPITVLKAQDGIPRWEEIAQLIASWEAKGLVVGIPYHMDGGTQPMTHLAMKFANKLRARFGLPVYTVDERLTTIEARRQYYAHDVKKKITGKSAPSWDSLAATLILEQWLRQQHNHHD